MRISLELHEVTRKGEYITKSVAKFESPDHLIRLFIPGEKWEQLGRPVNLTVNLEGDK